MKYKVTLYYHTYCVVDVEADNEEKAIELAQDESGEEIDKMLLRHLEEDDDPDVEEVQ